MSLTDSASFAPNPAPSGGLISIVAPDVFARVTVAPLPSWVQVQEVDESYRPGGGQSHTHILIDEQYHAGLLEHHQHTVQRLETLSAVHASSQWRFTFDPATQDVVVHSLLVRREGVSVEHAQPERFRFLQREEQLERLVIHGHVTVVVLLEDVRPGDVLDFSITTRTRPRLLPDRFWFFLPLPSSAPVRKCHVSVRFSTGRPLAWKSHDSAGAPVIEEAGLETIWNWTLENTVALEPEEQVPSWQLPERWIQVSDCASWSEVAGALLAAWREDLQAPELTRKTEEIAAGGGTRTQWVAKALDFVQDEIRYLSLNQELGGQIPSPPGEVLRRRFGDCKDKSFLLAQLLRRLGVSARPVLVNTYWRHSVEGLLPTPDLFDHVVVEYELEGQRFWADATLALQGGGALHRPVPDFRLGLPLSPDTTGLEPPPAAYQDSSYELHETYYLDTTGRPSQLLVQVTARGSNADELRRALASQGAEAVGKNREQSYRQAYDLSRLLPLEWRDDREQNVIVTGQAFNLTNVVVRENSQTAVFGCRFHLIGPALAFPNAPERRQPLALPFPCRLEHRISIIAKGAPIQKFRHREHRKKAFELEYKPFRGLHLWGISFKLHMLRDFLPASVFDQHKKWCSEIDPSLAYQIRLATDVHSIWHERREALLPSEPAPNSAETVEFSLETPALPSEPAPVLTTFAKPPESSSAVLSPPPRTLQPAVAYPTGPLRPRARPRRPRSRKRMTSAGLIIIVASGLLVFFAFWLALVNG